MNRRENIAFPGRVRLLFRTLKRFASEVRPNLNLLSGPAVQRILRTETMLFTATEPGADIRG